MSSTNDTTLAPRSAATPNARLGARGQSLVAGLVLAAGLMPLASVRATSTSADEFPPVIVLPGATSAEGIAVGRGSIFYAGDFLTGDIYRGDLRTGSRADHIRVYRPGRSGLARRGSEWREVVGEVSGRC